MAIVEAGQEFRSPFQRLSSLYNSLNTFEEIQDKKDTRGIVVSEETLGEAEFILRKDLHWRNDKEKLDKLTAMVNFRDPVKKSLRLFVISFSLMSDNKLISLCFESGHGIKFEKADDQLEFSKTGFISYIDGQDPNIADYLVAWFEDIVKNKRFRPLSVLTIPSLERF